MAMQTQTLPTYEGTAARAARLRLLARRRDQNVPGFVRRRLDEHAADDHPGDAPLGVAHTSVVERTPDADERLTGEGGAELGAREVYPTYTRPANAPPSQAAASAVPAQTATTGAPATPYEEGPAARRYRELASTRRFSSFLSRWHGFPVRAWTGRAPPPPVSVGVG